LPFADSAIELGSDSANHASTATGRPLSSRRAHRVHLPSHRRRGSGRPERRRGSGLQGL